VFQLSLSPRNIAKKCQLGQSISGKFRLLLLVFGTSKHLLEDPWSLPVKIFGDLDFGDFPLIVGIYLCILSNSVDNVTQSDTISYVILCNIVHRVVFCKPPLRLWQSWYFLTSNKWRLIWFDLSFYNRNGFIYVCKTLKAVDSCSSFSWSGREICQESSTFCEFLKCHRKQHGKCWCSCLHTIAWPIKT